MNEQEQIEFQLKQRDEELAVLNSIITAINQFSSLQEILSAALIEVENSLNLPHSEIWLWDELARQFKLAAHHNLYEGLVKGKNNFESGESLPGIIARKRQPLLVSDLNQSSYLQQEELIRPYNLTCALGVPMIARGDLTGVMIFFSPTASHFTPEIVARLTIVGHLIGTAIQNAHLYANLQQRITEQSALLVASSAISSSLDLKTVLSSLTEQLVKALKATSAYIADWDPETGRVTVLAEHFAPEASALERVSDLGVTYYSVRDFPRFEEWLQTGQIMVTHIEDADLSEVERSHLRAYDARSIIFIPFLIKGAVIGSAEVWETRRRRDFTLDELVLCQGIAQQGAVAIENARLFAAERKQLKLAQTLQAIGSLLTTEMSLEDAFERIFDLLAQVVDYDSVSIQWLDEAGNLGLRAARGFPDFEQARAFTKTFASQTLKDRWSRQNVLVIPDTLADPGWVKDTNFLSIRSWVGAALIIKGQLLGVLNVDSHIVNSYNQATGETVMAFANQAAVVLHDTRLFEQAQREIAERKQIEERLARQARELVLLNQIRMAIAREVDLPVVLKKVVEAVAHTLGYTRVSVYLLQNDTFVLLHQVGYNQPRQKISLSKQINQEIIQKPVLVRDIRANHKSSVESEEITSRVSVPLFDQKQVIGILNVESIDGLVLGEADLHLMTMLSEYINIAIERANLFAEARGNEEKYNALIEQSNDAIYLIYGNRFEMVNRKFRELFGVTQKELNDPNFAFTNIIAPKSRRLIIEQTNLEQSRQHAGSPRVSPIYEFTALDKDGKEIEVELSVSYPTYKGGLATQGVLRDITERKRVEAERATLQAQMFHSAKLASIGELAAGVAHEINNPIYSIREYADLILEETPKGSLIYGMLETVIREANRIADIVRNLLEFSRPSETNFNPIQLKDVWNLVYKLVAQSFYQQHIQIEVDIPEGLPFVKARGQQLQQVLLNLLTNARDALLEKYPGIQKHPQKRVTISARLAPNTFSLTYPDGEKIDEVIQLTVRDEGAGISPENRERLFTPFFTTKRPKSGTGLGLSICHKIIEEHHGTIEVESEIGQFTEFRIILPRMSD